MRHTDDGMLLDQLTSATAAGDSFVLPVFVLGEARRVVTEMTWTHGRAGGCHRRVKRLP
jgi:hypothetical protein